MYPEIGPGTRFFFFNELRESAKKNEEAAVFLNSAESIIFGGPNQLDEKIQQASLLDNIKNAIQFLEDMANFEAENEKYVFEQQLSPILNDPKYSEFKDIYKNNQINYPRLLVLINILNQDFNEVKALFQDLKQSTINFNKVAHKIIKDKKYDYTEIEKNRGQLVTDARNLANKMGLKINSTIAEIGASLIRDIPIEEKAIEARGLQLIDDNIINMIKSGKNQITLSSDATLGLQSMLQSKIREIAALHTEITGTQSQLKQLLNDIEQSEDLKKELLDELNQYAQELLTQMDIIETRGQQLQKLFNRNSKTVYLQNGKILGLTTQTRSKINNFLIKMGKATAQINLEKADNNNKRQDILNQGIQENYIQQLQESLEMQNCSLEDLVVEINNILKQMQQSTRKESITIMTESRSANLLYNLIPGDVIKDIVLDAMENGKNDATLNFLGKALYNSGLDQNFGQVISAEFSDFQKYYRQFLKENNPQIKATNTFNVQAQTLAVEQIENNIINDIEAELNQQLTPEQLKDIFVLDSSVKFAETFIADEGGFHGGSLGGDLEQQINNINMMLDYGGISTQDANWLMTAVLNAGNGMIGSSQRPALENYFSTVAAMLMFRTGGNTIQQWKEQITHNITTAPTKIHIYTFGTLFVPQSYILKLTAEGLRKCNNLLIQEADNSGSRAHIYNPVTFRDKKENFEATSKENYPKVKIQLTLLGGFLDILHQMEEIMNTLPI